MKTRRGIGLAAALLAAVFVVQTVAAAQWTWSPQTRRWINLKRMPKETAELQLEYARSLMMDGQYRKALRETDKFTDYYADSPLADDNQFLRGEVRLAQGSYMEAAQEFQKVVGNYPDSDLFEQVIKKQYEIGDKLYEKGVANQDKKWRLARKRPFKRAIQVYRMVIDNQPFTNAAAEAQYKVGLCHYTRKEYTEAAFEYQRVIEDYSASDWVDDAAYGLAMAHYKSALPPDYDQTPGQLAIDAVDDFAQRFPGDPRATELAEKRSEMRSSIAEQRLRIAKFYEKRREFEAARIYYSVVVDQFGETPAAAQAREWLAAHGTDTAAKAAS